MRVVDAAQRLVVIAQGRWGSGQLLHSAAAYRLCRPDRVLACR